MSGVPCPHRAVTVHLIDQAGQPTTAARDEILAFLAARLRDHHAGQSANGKSAVTQSGNADK